MEFDYVVVGAGAAGCVVAGRLAEDGGAEVALLEAGGSDDREDVKTPVFFPETFHTEIDWAYTTEPQSRLNDRGLFWPRGKVVGGSHSINAMIYLRGHPHVYDSWAENGAPGWSYEEALPYFKKSERQERFTDEYHGVDGPMDVADLRDPNPLTSAWVEAGVERGYDRIDDFNGARMEGVGWYQVTQRNGERWTTADAFVRPIEGRENFSLITGAHATRILLEGGRAVGVEYLADGETVEVRARKEVIVSGGSINSPQLLMLSGIGPADQLGSLGIDVAADLPGVGQNLQDHLICFSSWECKEPVSLINVPLASSEINYRHFRRGVRTSNHGEGGGFFTTREGASCPDLQFHFVPGWEMFKGSTTETHHHGFSVGSTLVLTESTGYLELTSDDPTEAPRIEANYLESEADRKTLIEGVKIGREIVRSKVFEPLAGREVKPGKSTKTDAEILGFVRQQSETLFHPIGTCRMGTDQTAVVDPELRVRGIDGLRVADASVMPSITDANTNAATIMIAEKAADLIRETETTSKTTKKKKATT